MMRQIDAQCCVVGGGPAGIMLGFLLARAGIRTVVLEKHRDFFRDFRGDTIHPSTLQLMYELGLLDEFLRLPHQKIRELRGQIGTETVTLGDFRHVPTVPKFLVLMPQWDFLNFLAEHAKRYPVFHLEMEAEATELLFAGDAVCGVRATVPGDTLEIRAPLVIGCDGRHSIVRERARLEVVTLGAPMDVLWFRLSRRRDDPSEVLGRFDFGRIMVLIDRGDYWQCGYVIRKGTFEIMQQRGIQELRNDIAELEPFLRERVAELRDWSDVKLLTVAVDRLKRWHRPGLLCIGDAAHAMSPIGGVGVNLAIQDAVAAANALVPAINRGTLREKTLHAIQSRRMVPTIAIQLLQLTIQNHVIDHVLGSTAHFALPAPLRLFQRWPYLRRFPARLIGVGLRPEHIRTQKVAEGG